MALQGPRNQPARPRHTSREAPYLEDLLANHTLMSRAQSRRSSTSVVRVRTWSFSRHSKLGSRSGSAAPASGSSLFYRPGPSWLMVLMPLPSTGCGSIMESIICNPVRCQHGKGGA